MSHCGGVAKKSMNKSHQSDPGRQARMSVVLMALGESQCLNWVMRQLDRQTIASDLQCILMASDPEQLESRIHRPKKLHSFEIVRFNNMLDEGGAKAAGVKAAGAPLVAILEDHTFPGPTWAEGLLKAHQRGDYAVVGPVVKNANPFTGASWGNFYVYYGESSYRHDDDELRYLMANHACYRRDVLTRYADRLPDLMNTEPLFQAELLAQGYKLHQTADSIAYHFNFSRIRDGIREYRHFSRQFAHQRAIDWGMIRRLAYILGSPLIPLVRIFRVFDCWQKGGRKPGVLMKMLIPALAVLCFGAASEIIGYAFGPGDSGRQLVKIISEREGLFSKDELARVGRFLDHLHAEGTPVP
jgi:hypothetical protein